MDVLELTGELVAVDSQNPGAGEPEIAGRLEQIATEQGFEFARFEPVTGRPNAMLSVDRGPGPQLALCGHIDTKPVGDALAEWTSDPLELRIADDRAFGLGTSDMKGAVAAMLCALENFARSGPPGRLSVLLTADEEQGSEAGSKALVASGELPDFDAMVIGEPSGLSRPWEALYLISRGICAFDIEIRTRQGHSGLSEQLGRNAVLVAADVLHALERFSPPHPNGPEPTVNPGMLIGGGVCMGTWPGACTIGCEIRLVPGMDQDAVRSALERAVTAAVGDQGSATIRYREGSLGWMPAAALDPQSPVVHAAQRAATRVLGGPLPVTAYPGGTDATYFMQAGIPAITSLGPGWLSVAHGPDECVGIDQLYAAVDLYTALSAEFLTRGSRK
ncbi:MAG TPA: M20/M25/M40 family metallo-hydrolase [Mycobacteriales bacterium]|nr:M20/M25/M40 family metallo-hydrolase [Mycobacteriales bacterium]